MVSFEKRSLCIRNYVGSQIIVEGLRSKQKTPNKLEKTRMFREARNFFRETTHQREL